MQSVMPMWLPYLPDTMLKLYDTQENLDNGTVFLTLSETNLAVYSVENPRIVAVELVGKFNVWQFANIRDNLLPYCIILILVINF